MASTVTPGLVGALMAGSVTGRTLAALHDRPFVGTSEAHWLGALADESPEPPYLVLLVSGGHTELIGWMVIALWSVLPKPR